MANGLNDIIESGVPVVQFNLLEHQRRCALRRRKIGRVRPHPREQVLDKLGGAEAKGQVILATASPASRCSRTAPRACRNRWRQRPASRSSARSTSRSNRPTITTAGSALAANPDAVALIGLCAPDVTSLGKLKEANGDNFVAGGYDLTEVNLKAIKDGHAYVTIGQSPSCRAICRSLLVNAIKQRHRARVVVLQCRDADRDRRQGRRAVGLPEITFDDLKAMAAVPEAARAYYKPLVDGVTADWQDVDRADRGRIRVDRSRWARATSSPRPTPRREPIAMAAIRIEQLRKRYGGVVALAGMNLDVAAGTIHAVVGENGAGKSTLMKVLAGAVRPDGGTIALDGRVVDLVVGAGRARATASASSTRSSASSPTARCSPTSSSTASRAASAWSRGGEMEQPPGRARPARPPRRRRRAGEPAHHRRAAAGRAVPRAAGSPRLLILDEPNSALNERETERLFAVLRELRRRGHHDALRVAPARGGVRDRRPHHGDAQRPRRADPGRRRDLTIPEVIDGDDRPSSRTSCSRRRTGAAARRASRAGRRRT